MEYKIICKHDKELTEVVTKIKKAFKKQGFSYSEVAPDLIICIGGDGTILHAVHQHLALLEKAKFVAIHNGTLGFLTDYTLDEIDEFIHDVINNKPEIFNAQLLEARVYEDDRTNLFYGLNEIRIENIVRTQTLDIHIDQEFFETIHGSGVCISTQLGSTAYNRSLKGAVIDDGLRLIQLCEITAIHHAKFRSLGVPYIMKSDRKIDVTSDDFKYAILLHDHKFYEIKEGSSIEVVMSDKTVQFARFRKYSYLDRIKQIY